MLNSLAAAGLALSFLNPVAVADIEDPLDKVTVELVTVNGSGCPKDTVTVAVAPDNTAFTVTYNAYMAKIGPNLDITLARRNCQAAIKVNVPNGFTFGIVTAEYRGYAKLAKDVSATQVASYYFQNSPDTDRRKHDFKGDFDDSWQANDSTEWAQVVWGSCTEKRLFNINTELRVRGDDSKVSYIAMDSLDAGLKTTYHYALKQC